MEEIFIRRQWNNEKIGKINFNKLRSPHWSIVDDQGWQVLQAYVWCNEVDGDIGHSCSHGPPPHDIKVTILKEDNKKEAWSKLLRTVGPRPKNRGEFKGSPVDACPAYVRIGTQRIKTGRLEYPNQGYDSVAWHLSIHLDEFFDMDGQELEELSSLVDAKDNQGIMRWFRWYLPKAMSLIPGRKGKSFLKGFWQAEYRDVY